MGNDRMAGDLEALLASYRTAMSVPDASPDFMPGLWARIEQRQRTAYSFRRLASGFVTAAAALCLMMSVALYNPPQSSTVPPETYIEQLAAAADPAEDLDQADSQGYAR